MLYTRKPKLKKLQPKLCLKIIVEISASTNEKLRIAGIALNYDSRTLFSKYHYAVFFYVGH